jgi:hypothetical protein
LIVTRALKFVDLALLVAALAWPAVALTACLANGETDVSGMKCTPDCPMMANRVAMSGHIVGMPNGAGPNGGSCCRISSGKAAPSSVPSSPANNGQTSIAPVRTGIAAPVATRPQSRPSMVEVAVTDTSPQAELCTFLI